ncbi:MAG: acyl-CoA dehydrogenase [Pseudomonadota bacterium]
MDFTHTDDRRMLADTIARFVREDYTFEHRLEIGASEPGFSSDVWARFAELGLIGALFSEDDGGFGGAGFDLAVVFEELGKGLVVEPFLPTLIAGRIIAAAGTDDQKAIVDSVIAGEILISFAHGEPEGRYGLADVSLTAERQDGGFALNGMKSVVPIGRSADRFVVSARSHGAMGDDNGLSLLLVDGEADGLTRRGYPTIDGGGAADLTFDNVSVPAEALIGEEGKAFSIMEAGTGLGLLALSAEALGVMEAAKSMTLDYLGTRKQFGRAIGAFQALQHRMAELLVEIEQMRSAVINAAGALEGDATAREMALSSAKYLAGKVGRLVAEETIQMHGGIGMTWEYALPHYAKRLIMIDHVLGDEDHHLARYIALSRDGQS